jgi:hypothetical protein
MAVVDRWMQRAIRTENWWAVREALYMGEICRHGPSSPWASWVVACF